MQLTEQFDRAAALLQKYDRDAALATRRALLCTEPASVPLLGACHVGKSTLVNALAGVRILPTGAKAGAAPAQVCCGPIGGEALRGTAWQPMGVGDFAAGSFDLSGVQRVRIRCQSPQLAQLPDLALVDLPGQDAPHRFDAKTARQELAHACGLLLVFSAEDPVVKRSLADFLAGCPQRGLPVCAVLTKCDKITDAGVRRAAAYLERELRHLLPGCVLTVATASAGYTVQLQPVMDFLCELQAQVETTRRMACKAALEAPLQGLIRYLALVQAGQSLTASQRAGQLRQLQSRLAYVQTRMEKETRDFHEQADAMRRAGGAQLAAAVGAARQNVLALLAASQDPAVYFQQAMGNRMLALAQSDWQPLWREYTRALSVTLHTSLLAGQAAGEPETDAADAAAQAALVEAFEHTAQMQCEALPERLREGLPYFQPIFDELLCGRIYGARGAAAAASVWDTALQGRLTEKLQDVLEIHTKEVLKNFQMQLDAVLQDGSKTRRAALCAMEQSLEQDTACRARQLAAWAADQAQAQELLAYFTASQD